MTDPNTRAGDRDRDRAAEALRRHFAEGRLSPEEFDQRLSAAYEARTYGQLDDLLADLPGERLGYELPVPVDAPAAEPVRRRPAPPPARHTGRAALASYLTVCGVCIVIWALSGGGYFWPGWVIGPWGVALLGGLVAGRRS